MADGTARALRLLELLQSADIRTVADLGAALGVHERTIRKDVKRLVELDVPVESVRGRYGGYRLAPGRRVMPLMFTAEEAVAVSLALGRAPTRASTPTRAAEATVAGQTALAKIRRALPADEATRVREALGAMRRPADPAGAETDPAVMLTVAEAVARRRVLDLRYRDRDGVPSRRTVHPYDLVGHANRWYLVALDRDKGDERVFRVDRIRTARSVPGAFPPPTRPDAAVGLVERFADADYRWTVVLRIRETAGRIRVHLPPSVARLELLDRGSDTSADARLPWHRAEIHAESLDWLPSVIAALDCEVIVDRPDELRDRLRDTVARLLRAAAVEVP